MDAIPYIFNALCNPDRLKLEIETETNILRTLDHIEVSEVAEQSVIYFNGGLSHEEHILLANIMKKHIELIQTSLSVSRNGWVYLAVPIEFRTSELGSLFAKLPGGVDNRPGINIKFYDADDNEVTTEGLLEVNEANIVKTEIDFEPHYNYEVIGGSITMYQDIPANNNCRIWILGAGVEMFGGVNLRYSKPQTPINVDNKVAMKMNYDSDLHSNLIKVTLIHDAGMKVDMQLIFDLYRPQ